MSQDADLDKVSSPSAVPTTAAAGYRGEPSGVARAVASGLIILYAVLTPAHLTLLHGTARRVMPLVAATSTLLLLLVWRALRRAATASPALVVVLAAVPVANSLVHLWVSGEQAQTSSLLLVMVGFGAAVSSRPVLLGLLGSTMLAWALVVRTVPGSSAALLTHYTWQLLMAAGLSLLLREMWQRRSQLLASTAADLQRRNAELELAQQQLRDSESNLAAVAVVSRRIRSREDPRETIVAAARELAEAHAAVLTELGEDGALYVTAADGLDLVGLRIPLDEPSLQAEVLRTGTAQFVPDAHTHPLVSRALLSLSSAQSLLFHPLVIGDSVQGVLSVIWDEPVRDENARVARAVALLADEAALALDHERLVAELHERAVTDPLTSLPNRRAWDHALSGMLASAAVSGRPVTVAMVDLDHFKKYNDARGHAAGDQLLRSFAALGTATLRGGDLMARWGGEEFAVALPDTALNDATVVLERLRALALNGQTCSIGVASWDGHEDQDALLARADDALYEAKTLGRDRIRAASPLPRVGGLHVAGIVPQRRRSTP